MCDVKKDKLQYRCLMLRSGWTSYFQCCLVPHYSSIVLGTIGFQAGQAEVLKGQCSEVRKSEVKNPS